MKHTLLSWLLPLLCLALWASPARAATPPAAGRSLAEALSPDGTLLPGATGSFDARAFRMGTAPDGRPVFRPAGTKGAGDERWQDGFEFNGPNSVVLTVVQAGANIYIGGTFTVVGNVVANRVAKWNGTAWSSLGTGAANGLNSTVFALAVAGNGDVYVGGSFGAAGGIGVNSVARWNGSNWAPVGTSSMVGNVYALAMASNGDLYAGGDITQAGGVPVNRVAKWNGTAWSALGTGANATVQAMCVAPTGELYASDAFTLAGAVAASRVAKWNGTIWTSLGAGLNGTVYAVALSRNGDLYAAGSFTLTGSTSVNNIAKWNGTAWSSLGAGAANGLNGGIRAVAVAGNGDVYAGGNFTQAGGTTANCVARWNGYAWSNLGNAWKSLGTSTNATANVLAVADNGDVYAGGDIMQVGGGPTATYLAKLSGSAWGPVVATTTNAVSSNVTALAVAGNGDVYVGGSFRQAGGVLANFVAKWNGTAWSSLGAGAGNGVDAPVEAVAVAGNGDVYVGGHFGRAGGVVATNVARWNGTAWSSLGTGLTNGVGPNGDVLAIVVATNGDVYVGGTFTEAGGLPASRVAKWDGSAWNVLGAGIGTSQYDAVRALAVAGNGDLYAGGSFTSAGGLVANGVAKWNGTAWRPLGTGGANGITGYGAVYAIAVAGNGTVYVGGAFSQVGGILATRVAKWNGTSWSALGAGTSNGVGSSGSVASLVVAGNGDLYAGGNFTEAGGLPANRVAKWNGAAWGALGTGVNDDVSSVGVGLNNKLYVGGKFSATGDDGKVMVRFAVYDPAAPLATATARTTLAAQLFPNPAHGTATLRLPAGAPRQPLLLADALGRLVRQYPAPAGPEAVLDLRGLPAGVYLVRCGALSQRLVVE